MLLWSNTARQSHFSNIQFMSDGGTEGQTNGPTDRNIFLKRCVDASGKWNVLQRCAVCERVCVSFFKSNWAIEILGAFARTAFVWGRPNMVITFPSEASSSSSSSSSSSLFDLILFVRFFTSLLRSISFIHDHGLSQFRWRVYYWLIDICMYPLTGYVVIFTSICKFKLWSILSCFSPRHLFFMTSRLSIRWT